MKHIFLSALGALILATTPPTLAQETQPNAPLVQDAMGVTLDDFKWVNRIVVVFADSPLDPSFRQQMDLLAQRPERLSERDVIVLTDTVPDTLSEVRKSLRPRGFAIVVVDKDGTVMLRKPDPWDVRELSHAIDKTPLRQQEIQDIKNAARAARTLQ